MTRVSRTLGRLSSTFRCTHCRLDVPTDAPGTHHRNHCPSCLWSRHLDDHVPGDRDAGCRAGMEPIAVTVRDRGEWALVHRCTGCASLRLNRIAADDNSHVLLELAGRPLERPPWPALSARAAPS